MNFKLEASDMVLALSAVKHAAPAKDIRHYLNGIRIEVNDVNALFVATDGHRLATVKTYLDAPAPEPFEFMIDSDQIPLLLKWLQQFSKALNASVTVTYERAYMDGNPEGSALPGNLTFGCAGSIFVAKARPHDEKFPDWRRVMADPSGFKRPTHEGAFNGEYLADVAKVAKLFNAKYGGIKVGLDAGLMFLECRNADGIEFRETLMGMRT